MAKVSKEKDEIIQREVTGSPSTKRVAFRYNELLTKEAYIDSERAELYTAYIKEHWNEPLYLRAGGALSAFPGSDCCGPTSLIHSATKIHTGNLQSTLFNMKFNPAAIAGEAGAKKFIALNDAYFNLGGYQVQYNVVDSKMLVDARKHPENYSDLMVRVAGFTAKFIDLGPDVQQQVIDRTQFDEA